MSSAQRLLLLEFVADSPLRNERADFFPFYKGFAESAGIPARWLCAGARFEGLKISPTEVRGMIVLERGDREMEKRFCSDAASRRAARNAARFARRRLEFSLILESIVAQTLKRTPGRPAPRRA